jgi:hypothetical protein
MNLDDIEALISKHGSITAQPLKDLVVTVVLEAIEAEREACATVCDEFAAHYWAKDDAVESVIYEECAAVIRARSNV